MWTLKQGFLPTWIRSGAGCDHEPTRDGFFVSCPGEDPVRQCFSVSKAVHQNGRAGDARARDHACAHPYCSGNVSSGSRSYRLIRSSSAPSGCRRDGLKDDGEPRHYLFGGIPTDARFSRRAWLDPLPWRLSRGIRIVSDGPERTPGSSTSWRGSATRLRPCGKSGPMSLWRRAIDVAGRWLSFRPSDRARFRRRRTVRADPASG